MTAPQIRFLIRLDQAIELLATGCGQHIGEDGVEMMADETLQVREREGLGNMP